MHLRPAFSTTLTVLTHLSLAEAPLTLSIYKLPCMAWLSFHNGRKWAVLPVASNKLHAAARRQAGRKQSKERRNSTDEAEERMLSREFLQQTFHHRCVQIGREFSERLASAHDTGCPWRTSVCDPSLAQFPPQDRSVVAANFAAQEKAVGRLNVLPPIAEDAYARINAVRRSANVFLHVLLSRMSAA